MSLADLLNNEPEVGRQCRFAPWLESLPEDDRNTILATSARSQANSSSIGGSNNENDVRAVTLSPIVTKAIPTITQP